MMDADMGFMGKAKIDAYLKTEFKGKTFKTKTISQSKGDDPVMWNTEFWFPAQIPVIQQNIHLYLMDAEDLGYDELAGSCVLKTKEILARVDDDDAYVWKNIYGSPLGQSNSKYKKKMNNDPEYATNWKGRILMHVSAELTDKPISK
jgi:Ca2+-dependent lipid-binding protein